MLLGIGTTIVGMEPPLELKVTKDKDRKSASSSSQSSSNSGGQISGFEAIALNEPVKLDTARLEKDGKIPIRNMDDLVRVLKAQGIDIEKFHEIEQAQEKNQKRASLVYAPEIPTLNMANVKRDISNQSGGKKTPDLEAGSNEEENISMEDAVNFFVSCMHEKHAHNKSKKTGIDLEPIKPDLIKKFKIAHNTPPPSPHEDNSEVQDLQKIKKGVAALRKASYYQITARANRDQQLPQSPATKRVRELKPLEILRGVGGITNDPEVHDNVQALEHMALSILSQQAGRTKQVETTLARTQYGGGTVAGLVIVLTGIITNIITKKTC